jgi:hypothetical protein
VSPADSASSPTQPRILLAGTTVAVHNFTRALGGHAALIPA